MSAEELANGLLNALDDDALSLLAERLRPHLDQTNDRMLDPREAADRLGLHERTVVRMAREGRLSGAVKVGRSWRFPISSLLASTPPRRPSAEPAADSRPRRVIKERRSVAAIRDAA